MTKQDALARLTSSNVIVTKLVVYQTGDVYRNHGNVMKTTIVVIGVTNGTVNAQTQDSNAKIVTVLIGRKLMMGKLPA